MSLLKSKASLFGYRADLLKLGGRERGGGGSGGAMVLAGAFY